MTIGSYYFRMYQMISEQERLIGQKEALWKRQKILQHQIDHLDQEIQRFDRGLLAKRETLKQQNLKSYWPGRNR